MALPITVVDDRPILGGAALPVFITNADDFQEGVIGPQGPQGPAGPAGAAGPQGPGGAIPIYTIAASNSPASLRAVANYQCDGTADQSEINTAIAALPSTGGVVMLLAGQYNISSSILIRQNNVVIMGGGFGARSDASVPGRGAMLKAATGITTAIILVQNATNDHPVYGVQIHDLNVDGANLGTLVDGIVFKSTQGLLENVYVHNCTGDGMQLEAYNGDELFDTRVVCCNSDHNVGAGIFLNTYAADSRILDCTLYTNGGAGLRVKAGGCQAVGGQFYNNDRGIWFDAGGSQFQAQDIKIENSLKEGIYFDAGVTGISHVMITGCGFRYNGKSANNTYPHIGGTGNQQCTNVIISGCRFNGTPAQNPDNKANYGIDLWGNGCQSWAVVGNAFGRPWSTHFGTAPIRYAGNASFPSLVRENVGIGAYGSVGTGTVPSGSTSVTITHNLAYTPAAYDITITPTNTPTNDYGTYSVQNIGATTFDVVVRANPGTSGFTFGWRIS